MALIHCPECNREISDTVKVCPDCGYKLKQPKREPKFLKTREDKKTFINYCVCDSCRHSGVRRLLWIL